MNKIFVISFKSLWLGGNAVIVAESEEDAIELLAKEHGGEIPRTDIYGIKVLDVNTGVKYYDSGDY